MDVIIMLYCRKKNLEPKIILKIKALLNKGNRKDSFFFSVFTLLHTFCDEIQRIQNLKIQSLFCYSFIYLVSKITKSPDIF